MAVQRLLGEILLEVRNATAALSSLESQTARAFNNMARQANQANAQINRGFQQTITAMHRFQAGVHSMTRGLAVLGGAFGLGVGISEITSASDSFIRLENRLKAATDSAGEFRQVYDRIRETSNITGTAIEENSSAFVRFNLNMDQVGGSSKDTLDIIDTLNKSFIIYGTTTTEAIAGTRQLAQAFASGRLQGDEFRSIMENLPAVGRALAETLGVSVGQLREMSREGVITSDIILQAMKRLRDSVNQTFEGITPTIAMAMQTLRNEFTVWIGEAEKGAGIARALTEAIYTLSQNIEIAAGAVAGFIALLATATLAGIVVIFAQFALIVGGTATALLALGTALGIVSAGFYLFNKASDTATKSAKAHAEAMEALNLAIQEVKNGTPGAVTAFTDLARAQLEAAEAAVKAAEEEVQAQKAKVVAYLQATHGIEEANRMISEGQFDNSGIIAAEQELARVKNRLLEVGETISSVQLPIDNVSEALKKATGQMRVMHGTEAISTANVNRFGQVIGLTKKLTDETKKLSKAEQEAAEKVAAAQAVISQHTGKMIQTTKAGGGQVVSLLNDMGRVFKVVDLVTGKITEVGNEFVFTKKQVELTADEAERLQEALDFAELNPLPELDEERFKQQQLAAQFDALPKKVQEMRKQQEGLLSTSARLWRDYFKGILTGASDMWSGLNAAIRENGLSWANFPQYAEQSIEEVKALFQQLSDDLLEFLGFDRIFGDPELGLNEKLGTVRSKFSELREWLSRQKLFSITYKDLGTIEFTVGDVIEAVKAQWGRFKSWWGSFWSAETGWSILGWLANAFNNTVVKPIMEAATRLKDWLLKQEFTVLLGPFQLRTSLEEILKYIQEKKDQLQAWLDANGLNFVFNTEAKNPLQEILDIIEVIRQQIELAKSDWAQVEAAWKEFTTPKTDSSGTKPEEVYTPLQAAMDTAIEVMKLKWNEFKQWLWDQFTVENAWGWMDAALEKADQVIAALRSAWETFFGWLKTESDKATPTPSIGDMGPQALHGEGKSDKLTAEVELELDPLTKAEADAALENLRQAGITIGAATGKSFYERLKEAGKEASTNILDVRTFGLDSIEHAMNVLWGQLKTGAQITFNQIEDLFKTLETDVLSLKLDHIEPSENVIDTRNPITDQMKAAFAHLDGTVRQMMDELGLYILNRFVTVSTNTQGIFSYLSTQISTTIGQLVTLIGEQIVVFSEVLSNAGTAAGEAFSATIGGAIEGLLARLSPIWEQITSSSTNAADAIKAAFEAAAKAVEVAINNLSSTVKTAMNSIVAATDSATAAMRRLEAAAKAAAAAARAAKAAASGSAMGGPIGGGMAAGGRVWGQGSSTSDSIWRRLSRGEYVIRAAAVSKYGQQLFDMLNHMTLPRDLLKSLGLNMGGIVGTLVPQMPRSSSLVNATERISDNSNMVPLNLTIGSEVFEGLLAPEHIAGRMMQYSIGKQNVSTGDKPWWYR